MQWIPNILYSTQWRWPRALWKEVQWKPKMNTVAQVISPNVIHDFFINIFQSLCLTDAPTLVDSQDEMNKYNILSLKLQTSILHYKKLNLRLKTLEKGTRFDDISPEVISWSLKECNHKLFQGTFGVDYPSSWSKQLLISRTKKGQPAMIPKLRDVAIGPILSRLFDIIINERLESWYIPNRDKQDFNPATGVFYKYWD